MNTVPETAPVIGLPQADLSVMRAAARPSKKTSGDPETIGLVPCPGNGHEVGSVTRAAGFPLKLKLLAFEFYSDGGNHQGAKEMHHHRSTNRTVDGDHDECRVMKTS
jgi:hypothetical protein